MLTNLERWAITQGYDPLKEYPKAGEAPVLKDGYLSPNFRAAEFACNHCGEMAPNPVPQELLDTLEDIRAYYGAPVTINSGYRCPTHNRNVGGATHSYHLQGMAADFRVKGVDPAEVYANLNQTHGGGLGKYSNFTHIDVRGYKARW